MNRRTVSFLEERSPARKASTDLLCLFLSRAISRRAALSQFCFRLCNLRFYCRSQMFMGRCTLNLGQLSNNCLKDGERLRILRAL